MTPGTEKFDAIVDLTMVIAGDCVAVTVAWAFGVVAVPSVAFAVLTIEPASISACVMLCEAEQVSEAPGTKPPDGSAGHVTVEILLSATETALVTVTLPVLVTR